jgi:hypothetical protein
MDFNKNVDKINDCYPGVSYNQVIDVDNSAVVSSELFDIGTFKSEYGKIDTSEENALIGTLITTARRMCEQYSGINFIARQVTAAINNFNGGAYLPYGPVGTITSVTDIDGNVIDSTRYKILGSEFKKVLWPLQELIFVYTGGYTTCPAELINAVKAQTLFLFENRGDGTVGMSPIAQMILNPLRRG